MLRGHNGGTLRGIEPDVEELSVGGDVHNRWFGGPTPVRDIPRQR
jgi:hypothetical protein